MNPSTHQRHWASQSRLRLFAASVIVGLGTCAVIPSQVASAATDTVTNCNNSGPGSLRQEVASASSGDTITFALSPACSTISDTTGTILITTNLSITGPGASVLALSGDNESGLFQIAGSVSATISGLTIEDGAANQGGAIWNNGGNVVLTDDTLSDNTAAGNGGGINSTGTLTLTNCTVSGNSATGDGGGIWNAIGTVSSNGSTLSENSAASGGGIYTSGTSILVNSTLSDNSAVSGSGGGIWSDGTLTFSEGAVSGNSAVSGGNTYAGGIYNDDTATITSSTVSGNTVSQGGGYSDSFGGGIFNNSSGTVTVMDTTISGNSASADGPYYSSSYGAGIDNSGVLTVSNSTLSDNSSSITGIDSGGGTYGGAIDTGGTTSLLNSTLVGNAANAGGDIRNVASESAVSMKSTIVAMGSGGDCLGGFTDNGYNIDDDGSCGFTLPSISDYATLSKTLGPLASNGGPTQTIALLPANPAIDYVPAPDCPATDQRGLSRTPPCDIGAYDTDGSGLTGQAITFASTAPTNAVVGGPTYPVSASGGGSDNPVTFTIDSSASSACSISGSAVSFIGVGTCVIDANQAGNSNYSAAPQAQQKFSVREGTPSTPTITNIPTSPIEGSSFAWAVSTTGDGATSVTSSTGSVCSVAGGTVSFVGAGTCALTAHVAAGTNYLAADGNVQNVTVASGAPAITSPNNANGTVGKTFSFTVTTSGAPVPSITKKGALPPHVTLVNNHNGTATISGTPTKAKAYLLTVVATFGTGATKYTIGQAFTLTVATG